MSSRINVLMPALVLIALACEQQQAQPGVAADTTSADTPDAEPRAAEPPVVAAENVLTPDGWNRLRIGMTRSEVVAAAGEDANPNAVGGPEPDQCDEWRPANAPQGLLVMIEQDRLTRITVSRSAQIKTDRGFKVGDSASIVKAAYGRAAEVTPHKYVDAPAEYITVWTTRPPGPDARGLVYEVGANGLVQHIRAGSASIQYVEGCL